MLLEHIAVASTFGSIFSGNVSGWWVSDLMIGGGNGAALTMAWPSDSIQDLYETISTGGIRSLSEMMNNVADSLTLNIRSRPGHVRKCSRHGTGRRHGSSCPMGVDGDAGYPLTLPLAFVVLVVFCAKRAGVELWKSSTLATRFHGLDENASAGLGSLRRIEHMEETAEELLVRLAVGERGWS